MDFDTSPPLLMDAFGALLPSLAFFWGGRLDGVCRQKGEGAVACRSSRGERLLLWTCNTLLSLPVTLVAGCVLAFFVLKISL